MREWKQLRWVRQVRVPSSGATGSVSTRDAAPSARERLIAALGDRPQTVAQLAEAFGLAQPTVLDHVRRALRDGLIVEVQVAAAERRFAAERYYAPTVPVIRAPDRELLESACRALAEDMAVALARHQGDLQAAFAMTSLAREGWSFADLWPYLHETIHRLALRHDSGTLPPITLAPHGLGWVEETDDFTLDLDGTTTVRAGRQEESA
jgi:DNA-binding transcriptional ArsR family regulator